MFWTGNRPIWRRTIIEGFLAALMTRPGAALISAPTLHLWVGSVVVTPDIPLQTLLDAEATFTGYPPGGVALGTLSTAVNLLPGVIGLHADNTFIVGTPVVVAENVAGYWIDQGAGADWVLAEEFSEVFPMANAGDFLAIELLLPLPLEQQAG